MLFVKAHDSMASCTSQETREDWLSMKKMLKYFSVLIALALATFGCAVAYADEHEVDFPVIAAHCVELLDTDQYAQQSASLASTEFTGEALTDSGKVYGVRYSHEAADAQSALSLFDALVDDASAQYGAPCTYDTDTQLTESTDDADTAAANAREYWIFAQPENFTLTISISGAEQKKYAVNVEFAIDKMPATEYPLTAETAQYISLIGTEQTDNGEGTVTLCDGSFTRTLIARDGKLTGIEYTTDAMTADEAAALAMNLFMQASTEYGMPLDSEDEPCTLTPIYTIAQRLNAAGDKLYAHWNLPFADGSVSGFGVHMEAGMYDDGARITLRYACE